MNLDAAIKDVDKSISLTVGKSGVMFRRLSRDSALHGGKKLRARIFFIFAGEAGEESVEMATAVELLHAATLVHDDILDNADTRRGRQALCREHGVKTGLLYGDYLFSSAFSLGAGFLKARACGRMAAAACETLRGEIIQNCGRGDAGLSKKEYFKIIRMKSGAFFGLACASGAMVRGLSEEEVENSSRCGVFIGAAYQLVDDYLDYFGKDSAKEKYRDLQEGVVTLPLIYLMRKCSAAEKKEVKAAMARPAGREKAAGIAALMESYGVPEAVRGDIEAFCEKSRMYAPGYAARDIEEYLNFFSCVFAGEKSRAEK